MAREAAEAGLWAQLRLCQLTLSLSARSFVAYTEVFVPSFIFCFIIVIIFAFCATRSTQHAALVSRRTLRERTDTDRIRSERAAQGGCVGVEWLCISTMRNRGE